MLPGAELDGSQGNVQGPVSLGKSVILNLINELANLEVFFFFFYIHSRRLVGVTSYSKGTFIRSFEITRACIMVTATARVICNVCGF